MDYKNKTPEQLFQHVLGKRVAHKCRDLTPHEFKEARCFFLAGIIMAKGIARDSEKLFTAEFHDELTALIEGQLETDRVLTAIGQSKLL